MTAAMSRPARRSPAPTETLGGLFRTALDKRRASSLAPEVGAVVRVVSGAFAGQYGRIIVRIAGGGPEYFVVKFPNGRHSTEHGANLRPHTSR